MEGTTHRIRQYDGGLSQRDNIQIAHLPVWHFYRAMLKLFIAAGYIVLTHRPQIKAGETNEK